MKATELQISGGPSQLSELLPLNLRSLGDLNTAIPTLVRDIEILRTLESLLPRVKTVHQLYSSDARSLEVVPSKSVHLVLTSPPYWTLKEYDSHDQQMGSIANYEEFVEQLERVWAECFRVLVPGGRLIVVVGDVCLSRRKNEGRHTVVPLHSAIQEGCRRIGFDNLAPIIWHKIANARYEVEGNGAGFLGKPYEPNAVIKNDIEFVLMERKSGGYRAPDYATRLFSMISEENYRKWFQQIWEGVTGASTRDHPAPFPIELADRLIRMFSFVGDTVLDPFLGSGTTSVAAAKIGRNSIGIEIIPRYLTQAADRLYAECQPLFGEARIEVHG
jgi:modification methylase